MRSDQVDVYREIAEVDRQLDALAKDMGFMTKLNTRNALFERRQQLVKQTEEPLKKWGVRVLLAAVTVMSGVVGAVLVGLFLLAVIRLPPLF
ncbi:unnamed protein product [Vitrella brassicaformis CCMP3155]|uniref:Uncharacterized protein n=1 Tax=Vitrella brassicaformis (strain CCMP3155) TaxID=1169540 RepID=A0A0G4GUZ6_VITBC|nr:unnamed protein product [Vitrella brassicaformis CCMP3155]|eukprot:CEM34718.1 unnamed protein product [Vitrella brassicaformis CCMP3155]